MREKCTAILRRVAAYLKVFARRTALSVLIGLLCGGLGGCSVKNWRMVPVMARRRSESMLILHTALRAA